MIDRKRVETEELYKNEMRLRCQTDILFLARLLGYDKVLDRVHGPVAELCVRKNPAIPIEDQTAVKERINLDPRGTFKTSLSITDSVQWIICFPNVRICKLTATKPLAAAIANEIRDKFVKNPIEEPTDFQLLFPEFCISDRDKREGEYTAPNRTKDWKEKTVMAFSIETSISGWHFDVWDPDDVVDTQNSGTPQGIKKVKKNYGVNKKTLMPWGYINSKGTRYDPFDLWGERLEKARLGKTKVLKRAALILKDGSRLEPGDFPAENEMELLFPELLSYEFLKDEFEDNYESFMTQYMNDAHGGSEVTFDDADMLNAVIPAEEIPVSGQIFVAWRFACMSKGMKYAAGVVGLMEGGRMYIVDAARGTFKPSSLAHKVVFLAKKHGTHNITIEDTPGARTYLDSAIQNYAATMGWPLQITWVEFQEDDAARDLRIKGLEPLIPAKRLLFSASIGCLKEMHKQFCHYGAMEEFELPDAVSQAATNLPKSIIPMESSAEQDLAWELAKQKDMFDRTHGLGNYAPPVPIIEEVPYEAPKNNYGLSDELGGLNG